MAGPKGFGFDVDVDFTNWRKDIQNPNRIKFDDQLKKVWLDVFAQTNLKSAANKAAGIAPSTYQHHIANDPEFKNAVRNAIQNYRDKIASEVFRRGAEGWLEPVFRQGARAMEPILDEVTGLPLYDNQGRQMMRPANIRRFDSQLLQMEAKRIDHSWREKAQDDGDDRGGGVLVAPARKTPDQFIKEQMAKADRTNAPADVE